MIRPGHSPLPVNYFGVSMFSGSDQLDLMEIGRGGCSFGNCFFLVKREMGRNAFFPLDKGVMLEQWQSFCPKKGETREAQRSNSVP